MHLVYLLQSNKFVLYDSYRFVGLPEEKKYWHFTRRMPKNLPGILAEAGFAVSDPPAGTAFYQERTRWLRKEVCLTVQDQLRAAPVSGTGETWLAALNALAEKLERPAGKGV